MIRVFLADEHPVVIEGLQCFFQGTEFQVVGVATNRLDLLSELERCRPQMVVIDTRQDSFRDFSGPSQNYRSLIPQQHRATCQVVEWTAALQLATKAEILDFLRRVGPRRVSVRGTSLSAPTATMLTPREIQVLQLIVQGRSNKEIAKTLGITLHTVKEHVHNILHKTSNSDRTQAALWAVRNGLASL